MQVEASVPGPAPRAGARGAAARAGTALHRLVADRVARWVVTAGGLAIIASILGILAFILIEIWPLLGATRVAERAEVSVPGGGVGAAVTDEYRSQAAVLSADGRLRVVRWDDGDVLLERTILDDPPGSGVRLVKAACAPGESLLTASTSDGRLAAVPVAWDVSFAGQDRVLTPRISDPVWFDLDPSGEPVGAFAVRVGSDGAGTAAAQLADGRLVVVRRDVDRNLLTGEVEESRQRFEADPVPRLGALVLDEGRRTLYGGTSSGKLLWWDLRAGAPAPARTAGSDGPGVTALSLLIGDRSLVVGRRDGALEIWFQVRQPDESFDLEHIRDFPRQPGAIRLLAPSRRGKGFAAMDDTGRAGLYYSTSHRVLWTGRSPLEDPTALSLAPRADGALLGAAGRLSLLDISSPHPEVSLKALFGKVWYEGYPRPQYVWQSSSATDEFEPKLSLTPLMIGTLKGTLYSLVLAIPLGVLAAMYASQFMHPSLKRVVKPTVEIMAALPSVVLGFLAGLWLAPRVERIVPGLALAILVVPAAVLAAGFLWRALPAAVRGQFQVGAEVFLYVVAVAVALWICLKLSRPVEAWIFGGDFQEWLRHATGLRYDQRNAIVVGLAMGFAVIPIIFSIAEDAFSNVPRNLVAGSLALGANRWQTVTRVVLPTASAGIFSAIMIGFGRAVGETMIVLMATGNTPLMDWNPFNGFRTLSANIAVEIPEAPQGGTLYRTLFLAALILFVLTFLINTVAELIRQRLRRRYSQL